MNTPNESKRPSVAAKAAAYDKFMDAFEARLKQSPLPADSITFQGCAILLDRYARDLDAEQPAQAGEAVYQVKFRTQGSGWVTVDRESYESPLAYLPEHYERRVAYLHPQPEQPASAVGKGYSAGDPDVVRAMMQQNYPDGCSDAAVSALDAEIAAARSPAVSPPSVVAVSDEDVEVAAKAAFDAPRMTWEELVAEQPDFADEIRGTIRAALESFASRMGSGEKSNG